MSTIVHVNPIPVLQCAYLAINNNEHYGAVILPPNQLIKLKIPTLRFGSDYLSSEDNDMGDEELISCIIQMESNIDITKGVSA